MTQVAAKQRLEYNRESPGQPHPIGANTLRKNLRRHHIHWFLQTISTRMYMYPLVPEELLLSP